MLAWLKDRFRPIRHGDPVLGNMRYLRDGQFWEGWTQFVPIGAEVEVLLSGAPLGPTEEQRAFLKAVEARYDSLWPAVEDQLREAASADPACRQGSRFVLKGIDLPEALGSEPTWELLYETDPPS